MLSKFKFIIILLSVSYIYCQEAENRLVKTDIINSSILTDALLEYDFKGEESILSRLTNYNENQKKIFINALLLKAAQTDRAKLVQYLLDLGADIDVQEIDRFTKKEALLHTVARLGHEEVAQVIINNYNRRRNFIQLITEIPENLAKIIRDYEKTDFVNLINENELQKFEGCLFPNEVACKYQKYSIFKSLFNEGAFLSQQIITAADKDPKILDLISSNVKSLITVFDIRHRPCAQMTLLTAFIKFTNNTQAVSKLITIGADTDIPTAGVDNCKISIGPNPIMLAVALKKHAMLKILIDAGLDANIIEKYKFCTTDQEDTPLLKAVLNVDLETVKLLLSVINTDIYGKNSRLINILEFAKTWYTPPARLSKVGTPEIRNQIISLLKDAQAKLKAKST